MENFLKNEVEIANSQLKELVSSLNESSAYSPYIHFTIGKDIPKNEKDERYNMDFDTLSGLGKGTNNNSRHYLMSVEMRKIGLDSANTWKVRIAFVPDISPDYDKKDSLFDKIEQNQEQFQKFDNSILFRQCRIQYGYFFPNKISSSLGVEKKGISGNFLLSPSYYGQIINYTMEILNGYIIYEIECVSSACALVETTIDKSSGELYETAGKTHNPIKLVKNLLEEYIESNDMNYEIIDNVSENISVCEDGNGNPKDYVIFNENVEGLHIFDYIGRVLSRTVATGQWEYFTVNLKDVDEDEEPTEAVIPTLDEDGDINGFIDKYNYIKFSIYIIDYARQGETPKIVIDYSPKNDEEIETKVNFDFEWLSGNKKNIVINFQPSFYGSVFFGLMDGYVNTINQKLKEYYSKYGNKTYITNVSNNGFLEKVKKKTVSFSSLVAQLANAVGGVSNNTPDVVDESGGYEKVTLEQAVEFLGTFEALKNSVSKAKLQTLGIPYPIPLISTITITPIINNSKHFSGGDYFVTSVTDVISSGGFQTSIDLVRNPTEFDIFSVFMKYKGNQAEEDGSKSKSRKKNLKYNQFFSYNTLNENNQ